MKRFLLAVALLCKMFTAMSQTGWYADNGNGTFTNPLFYDEFSDPDLIRVNDDYYLAGTTMHAVPGLVVLHSRDLVNWDFCSFAAPRLNLGDRFSLINGDIYGQGIWAPCIRYHNDTFYLFSNVNGAGLQIYTSKDPRGPWTKKQFSGFAHDLSVLFDDDGSAYAVFGYGNVHIRKFNKDMTSFEEGFDKIIISEGQSVGEGHHIYKIDNKYYIISADYASGGRMSCSVSDNLLGPYKSVIISADESYGYNRQIAVTNGQFNNAVYDKDVNYTIDYARDNKLACANIHQGGIVQTSSGQWWGFSMMDFNSVGRTVCLSPVTWIDSIPYFGLENNPGRSPLTWTKPVDIENIVPHAPYQRSFNFDDITLPPVFQWNHNPDDKMWSLTEKKGMLTLHALNASDLMTARNTLTQRCIGPISSATVTLDFSKLKTGDCAGLAIINLPYAYLGVVNNNGKNYLEFYDNLTKKTLSQPISGGKIYLRSKQNHLKQQNIFAYSQDGKNFTDFGDTILMPYQLKTFQGARWGLYCYTTNSAKSGKAYFDDFIVDEPCADRSNNIPVGKKIYIKNRATNTYLTALPNGLYVNSETKNPQCLFVLEDCSHGKYALKSVATNRYLTVVGLGLAGDARQSDALTPECEFMYQDMPEHRFMLLSMINHRYLGCDPLTDVPYGIQHTGSNPGGTSGCVFTFETE